MKLKKIIAAVAAAAVAVSTMAINAFAYKVSEVDGNYFAYVKGTEGWSNDTGRPITDVYGVTFHVKFNADDIANGVWIGGNIGYNTDKENWKVQEWANMDGKPILADVENGTITYKSSSPVFQGTEEWAQLILQVYDGATVTVESADLLDKDGKPLSEEAGAAAPAETEAAPAETTAAPAETEAAPADAEEEAEPVEEEAAPAEEEESAEEEAAPAETEAAPAETAAAPAAEATTTSAATGNTAVASIAAVMAAAGIAVIASRKRK